MSLQGIISFFSPISFPFLSIHVVCHSSKNITRTRAFLSDSQSEPTVVSKPWPIHTHTHDHSSRTSHPPLSTQPANLHPQARREPEAVFPTCVVMGLALGGFGLRFLFGFLWGGVITEGEVDGEDSGDAVTDRVYVRTEFVHGMACVGSEWYR